MKPKSNRQEALGNYDNCGTPTYAWLALAAHIKPNIATIWEPAAGDGYLARDMRRSGYGVAATELSATQTSRVLGGVDFLKANCEPPPTPPITAVITNPPYSGSLKTKFLARCFELGLPFGLLMPHEFGSTGAYASIAARHGVCSEIRFVSRVNFRMPDFGWTGSENKEKMLDHWRAVRIAKWKDDPVKAAWIDDPAKLDAVPSAQFPVTWFTWNLTDLPLIFYVNPVKTETDDEL